MALVGRLAGDLTQVVENTSFIYSNCRARAWEK